MDYTPCTKRTFLFQINVDTFAPQYFHWFFHLYHRIGLQNTISVWEQAFNVYDSTLVREILCSGWVEISRDFTEKEKISTKYKSSGFDSYPIIESINVEKLIGNTPPINLINQYFGNTTQEKEITAYEALCLRFDGLANLAETMIDRFGKQGELIVYDLMVSSRLADAQNKTGSVEEFIADFTSLSEKAKLFSAGLELEIIKKTNKEAIVHVHACEWARFFRDHHPQVGYLLACSTDEIAYKTFNEELDLQRTETLMEGGEKCDFRVFCY